MGVTGGAKGGASGGDSASAAAGSSVVALEMRNPAGASFGTLMRAATGAGDGTLTRATTGAGAETAAGACAEAPMGAGPLASKSISTPPRCTMRRGS